MSFPFSFSLKALVLMGCMFVVLMYLIGTAAISFASGSKAAFSDIPHDLAATELSNEEAVNLSDADSRDTAGNSEPVVKTDAVKPSANQVHDVYYYALPGELDESNQLSAAASSESAVETPSQSATETDGEPSYEELLSSREWKSVTSETFSDLETSEKVELIGQMAHDDALQSGVPASITAAQAILESGWMESDLTCMYENYFGIKASSEGFNWEDSTWTPGNGALMTTQEEYTPGNISTIQDTFRVYNGTWESIKDHSAYLSNMLASTGGKLYEGITDPSKTVDEKVQIIMDGGYATGSDYAAELLYVIDTYDLSRFDI